MKRAIVVFVIFALLLTACVNDSATGKITLMQQPTLGAGIYRLGGVRDVRDLSWSPNGKYLAVLSSYQPMPECWGCRDGYSEIFTVDISTLSRKSVLKFNAGKCLYSVSWFPDSTMLVYVSNGNATNRFGQSWSVRIDGEDNAPFMDFERKPVWSPDGSKLAAASHISSPPDWYATIVVLDKETGSAETIFKGDVPIGQISEPSWSPDGQSLAFTHGRFFGSPPLSNAFTIDIKTRRLTQLTQVAQCTFAKFAPRGHLIALGCGSLILRDIASRCQAVLPISNVAWQASWSPDGREVATTNGNEVYILDLREHFGPKFAATGSICP